MMGRVLMVGMLVTVVSAGGAQGTKLWNVDRYEEFAKGTAEGVAIRSDGRLEAGPGTSLVSSTGGSYVWSLTADATGTAYAGLGGAASGAAVVMKVAPDGKSEKVFEGKEMGVQALRVLPDGALVVATSPEGKVYRVAGVGAAEVVFDPQATEEKPKYLWDVAVVGKSVFVATGAPAAVYRMELGGGSHPTLVFRTTDQHIRCLLATPDGMLWAGTDGSGVIYRIAVMEVEPKPFAVYAAPRREITALAADGAGNVYAAGVGAKGASSLPPLPVSGAVGVSIMFVQPGSANAASTNTVLPEGSEIYRIAKDGSPTKLLNLKDDVVYALAFLHEALLAATGNRGRVYQVDTAVPGRFTDLAHLDAAQGMAFAVVADGLLVATSNSGKLYKLRDRVTSPATYTSSVFDAQGFARWGKPEVRASSAAALDLYARSGNVESPLMGWSEWTRVAPEAATLGVPAARYAQWRAVLREGATLDAVGLNYLATNVAPGVDEVVVQVGARVPANAVQPATTVQIAFPPTASASPAISFQADPNAQPLTAQKDRTAVTVRWAAHDDNGDELSFSVFYQADGEANWHMLKDKIADRFLSFDAALLPDGGYRMKVVAADVASHPVPDALRGEKASELFVLDTTPPVVEGLRLVMDGAVVQVTAEAHDATSPIARAEYSLDAGPWQYVEPTGKLSDTQRERYGFAAGFGEGYSHEKQCAAAGNDEHLLAMRVYDRYENVGTAKATVDRSCIGLSTSRQSGK